MLSPGKLSREIMEAALRGLEAQRQRIDDQIAQIRALVGPSAGTRREVALPEAPSEGGLKRRFSASTRAKMAAAQRRRWAAAKTATAPEAPRKRKLSAAGRKAIAAAAKRRWAQFRKRAKEPAKTPAKKAAAGKAPKKQPAAAVPAVK
jgi:hypothetical protein